MSEFMGMGTWQNIRRSSAFSHDGGRTYYDVDESRKRDWLGRRRRNRMHRSAPREQIYV